MAEASIFYRYPRLYKSSLRLLHGKEFGKRYRYIAGLVGRRETVLEPGCGPVVLGTFLPGGAKYSGFDMNEAFVKHAKGDGWKVWSGDALEKKNYNSADVEVACDVYHHMSGQNRDKFIKLCWKTAKRAFVICEPGGGESDGVWEGIKKGIAAWGDRDGTNKITAEHYITGGDLQILVDTGFGVIGNRIKRVKKMFGRDAVTVFYKA